VNLQIDQLEQIKVVAEKLQKLRADRDKEKKEFDEIVGKLNDTRAQINEEKTELKKMYK